MFFKIVKNDFIRKKIITGAVCLFITMAVILGASATNIVANLVQSMSELEKHAVPSDIAQMHFGEYDQAKIDKFTEEQQENIAMQETVVLLNVAGRNIHFGKNETMDGKEGKVAVPIYFMEQYDLKIGDTITVKSEGYQKEFVI